MPTLFDFCPVIASISSNVESRCQRSGGCGCVLRSIYDVRLQFKVAGPHPLSSYLMLSIGVSFGYQKHWYTTPRTLIHFLWVCKSLSIISPGWCLLFAWDLFKPTRRLTQSSVNTRHVLKLITCDQEPNSFSEA